MTRQEPNLGSASDWLEQIAQKMIGININTANTKGDTYDWVNLKRIAIVGFEHLLVQQFFKVHCRCYL